MKIFANLPVAHLLFVTGCHPDGGQVAFPADPPGRTGRPVLWDFEPIRPRRTGVRPVLSCIALTHRFFVLVLSVAVLVIVIEEAQDCA